MSAQLKFCPECNNLLYPRENKREVALEYACRTCPYVQRVVSKDDELENINADDLVVFRNDVSYHHKEALMIRSDVIHDPTLSRTTEYTCNNCPNHEAVFWQLPESQQTNAMALIFVCTACTAWRIEGKE
ncbi:DNA-directed RNA polymerase II subunit RPB9 [Perkinsus olseni]|uniref:DNA-directed RNA polymerase II subunit RPB9 n=2 Tax=Perkinsus TaxID=28000 RepID=A0A7J6P949_PEROL|nr:DNA-directed RNA polymerase 2 subunit, putative [Perkinsus marinus ATCC 50983]KAF4668954.1 DNA-directed RNA polymerase II subunit RPB9 [Perkinsus olseni]EER15118.1 DNA-directed RNA polymerase 2 subunit, putative [Perkinsus marinus ATCC 50983]KAF4672078.1 DNA-directed RNA polymerase II subunit RPB9 [Perkinsus olseni]KAF4692570.1 DNA-directed RNA polymerase II subunit RPB9, variant 2 [Perkinsus olseni]KAF4692582.1 DNA-directed RNA polymerase II subunit RPB9 [Perkinsus olseni]|eukprot:XP_002783322.1 DNA-directed RNA polymerase 2 subunit, putative [Perkinsus marinus ATCC 50983]